MVPKLRRDHVNDALGLTGEISLRHNDGQLQLNEPDDDAIRRFVEAAKSAHIRLLFVDRKVAARTQTNPIFPDSKRLFFRRRK
jgi:hypothetical protein